MKIMLFTGFAGWTETMHNLALKIKKNNPNTSFTAYTLGVHNKEFLKNQKELEYENIYCSDELRIKYWNSNYDLNIINELEKKYGKPLLTSLFYTDRRLVTHSHPDFYDHDPSHKEILNVFQNTFLDLEKIVEDHDLVVSYHPASSESQVLHRISEYKKIPFMSVAYGRIGSFLNFQKEPSDTNQSLISRWNDLNNNKVQSSLEAQEYYSGLIQKLEKDSDTSVPWKDGKKYFVNSKKINPFNIFKLIKNIIKGKPIQNDKVSRRTMLKKNILFKYREKLCGKYFSSIIPDNPYAVYPLHLDPEASTLVIGVSNYDVLGVIKRLSLRLPATWKLLVKEHGAMVGKRPIGFYKELENIYNVEIIHPNFNSIDLVKNSEAVITNTGTMGIEAAILGKRVICLGQPLYSFIPSILTPPDINDIENILSNNWGQDEKIKCKEDMKKFVEAVYDVSLKFDDDVLWNSNPDKNKIELFYEDFFVQFKKDALSLHDINI